MISAGKEIMFSIVVGDRADWPLDGQDTVIAVYDDGLVTTRTRLMEWSVALGEKMAIQLGTHLHHADFVITGDPETVRHWGMLPDHTECHECIVGVEHAVIMLEEDPKLMLAVGQLYWSPRPGSQQPRRSAHG